MSGENWKRLEQLAREDELKKMADEQRRLSGTIDSNKRLLAFIAAREQEEQRKREASGARLDRVISRLTPILEDIRIHSPEIRSAPQSRVIRWSNLYRAIEGWQTVLNERQGDDSLLLQWGLKLGPTSREINVINNQNRPFLFPSMILVGNFACIHFRIGAHLDYGDIDIGGDPYYGGAKLDINQFLADSSTILPPIHKVFKHADHHIHYYRFVSGTGWVPHFLDNNGHPPSAPAEPEKP